MEFFIAFVLVAIGLVFLIAGVSGNAVGLWATTLGHGTELPLTGIITGHGRLAPNDPNVGTGPKPSPAPLPGAPLHPRGVLPLPGPHGPIPVPR